MNKTPADVHTNKALSLSCVFVLMYLLSCVGFGMCPLIYVLSLCSHVCSLSCSHMRALMCMRSCVCSHIFALICAVCLHVCALVYVLWSAEIRPCLGSLAGMMM